MIRSLYYSGDGSFSSDLRPEEFPVALQDTRGLLWVDLVGEPPEVCAPILLQTFGFHPLAVDDALHQKHIPKVDDWGQYLYLVLHAVVFAPQNDEQVSTQELDAFLGANYLVTFQSQSLGAAGRVWSRCLRDERYLQKGSGHLFYRLADEVVSDYMLEVDKIDEAINQMEDQIFDRPDPSLLERIFSLKRALLHLRRIIAPQREVLNKLARGDFEVIAAEDQVFFRDVYDHLVRLYDITESLRDLVGSALETYLSVVSNRMNDIMKTLTVIMTMFMPVSFLVGFFGMNFFQPVAHLETWTSRLAFGLVLGALILLPLAMFLWMRKRAWM